MVWRSYVDASRKILHNVPFPRVPILPRGDTYCISRPIWSSRLWCWLHEWWAWYGTYGLGLHQIAGDSTSHGCLCWWGAKYGMLPSRCHLSQPNLNRRLIFPAPILLVWLSSSRQRYGPRHHQSLCSSRKPYCRNSTWFMVDANWSWQSPKG